MGLADCPEKTCFAVHAELEQEVLHGFVNEGPANGGLILSIGRSAEKGGLFALFPHVHSRQKVQCQSRESPHTHLVCFRGKGWNFMRLFYSPISQQKDECQFRETPHTSHFPELAKLQSTDC